MRVFSCVHACVCVFCLHEKYRIVGVVDWGNLIFVCMHVGTCLSTHFMCGSHVMKIHDGLLSLLMMTLNCF